jgi:hypothetical protein
MVAEGWPETPWQWVRAVGNVVNLTTPLGLAIAAIGRATWRRGPRGLVLAEGYRLSFPVAGAFTVGNVIITSNTWDEQLRRHPGLLQHEERHSSQYAVCLGLPFFVAYTSCMGWSMLRTGDRAAANFFETNAGLGLGGYRRYPKRSLRAGVGELLGRLRRSTA